MLKLPIFGELVRKATIARWSRTLATMFAAGVPLVEAFDSVAGAAGNAVYFEATKNIQRAVSTGNSLTSPCRTPMCFRAWCCKWWRLAKKPARWIPC